MTCFHVEGGVLTFLPTCTGLANSCTCVSLVCIVDIGGWCSRAAGMEVRGVVLNGNGTIFAYD